MEMHKRNKLIHVVLLLLISTAIYPQVKPSPVSLKTDRFTKFYSYFKKDGICSYLFTDITQDKQGYIWIATQEGLMRFDGYTFCTYTLGSRSNQLPDSYISSIVVDGKGTVWIGTKGGLCRYNQQTNDFTRITSFFGNPLLGGKWIKKLYLDSKQRLWIEAFGGVLSSIDFSEKTVKSYQHNFSDNNNFFQHALTEFNGGMLTGGSCVILSWLKNSPNTWVTFNDTTIDGREIHSGAASDFYDDGKGNLWVANFARAAYTINKRTLKQALLPFNSAYTFADNGDGNVWVGGYAQGARLFSLHENSMISFLHDDNNPCSIAGDQIFKIFRDKQGCLWFGTSSGLSLLTPHRNRFTHIRKIPESNGLPTNRVQSLLADPPNILWVGSSDKGLVRYDLLANTFKTYSYNSSSDSIGSNTVTSIARNDNKSLYLTLWNGNDGALNLLSIPEKKFTRFATRDKYFWYSKVIKHTNGKILVGPWCGNLWQFDLKKKDYTRDMQSGIDLAPTTNIGPSGSIQCSDKGWVAIHSTMLFYNLVKGDSIVLLTHQHNQQWGSGIPQKNLIIYHSNEESPCVSIALRHHCAYLLYQNSAIAKVDLGKRSVRTVFKNPATHFSGIFSDTKLYLSDQGKLYRWNEEKERPVLILKDTNIAIAECGLDINEKRLLIGTSNGLFVVNRNSRNQWELGKRIVETQIKKAAKIKNRYFFATLKGLLEITKDATIKKIHFQGQNIASFTVDSVESLWLATDKGLFRMNLNTGSLERLKPQPKIKYGLPSDKVYNLATDVLGDVWIVNSKCISKYSHTTAQFINYLEPSPKAISSGLICEVFEDKQAFVWLGYTDIAKGIDRVNLKTNRIEHFIHKSYEPESFPLSATNCITETADGQILVGTDLGLAIMKGRENRFRIIDQKLGLPSNRVTALKQDQRGLLWVGTDKGVATFNLQTGKVERFQPSEGMLAEGINAITTMGIDKVVVAGDGGINIFNPSKVGKDNAAIPLHIKGCRIDGAEVRYNLADKERVILNANHKTLEIEFAGLDYNVPENIRYAYILEGFDDSLTYVSHLLRVAKYSNLPHGHYRFKVLCCNADGIWSSKPTTLEIVVEFPFYISWWFILLCLGAIALLFFFILKRKFFIGNY